LYGGGSVLPIRRRSSAFDGRIFPGSKPKERSWARAAEWNVRVVTPSTPRPARRSRISAAALSVKVTARSCRASKVAVATWFAIRLVIVVVFPEPAPARMQTGPRTVSTACRCSSLSPAKIRSRSISPP
jgi:hypothetical protein